MFMGETTQSAVVTYTGTHLNVTAIHVPQGQTVTWSTQDPDLNLTFWFPNGLVANGSPKRVGNTWELEVDERWSRGVHPYAIYTDRTSGSGDDKVWGTMAEGNSHPVIIVTAT
jgi:hypothetical protein